jgi:hypothetical protein
LYYFSSVFLCLSLVSLSHATLYKYWIEEACSPVLRLDIEPDEDVGDGLEEEEGDHGEHGQEGEQVPAQEGKTLNIGHFSRSFVIFLFSLFYLLYMVHKDAKDFATWLILTGLCGVLLKFLVLFGVTTKELGDKSESRL